MHRNFLFDLDQTLLDFHASEHKALGIVLQANGLSFSDETVKKWVQQSPMRHSSIFALLRSRNRNLHAS